MRIESESLVDLSECTLAHLLEEMREEKPDIIVLPIQEAVGSRRAGVARIAVATSDRSPSRAMWEAAVEDVSITAIFTDAPVDELRAVHGLPVGKRNRIIACNPFVALRRPTAPRLLDILLLRHGSAGQDAAAFADLALRHWSVAGEGRRDYAAVHVSNAAEVAAAASKVRRGGLCIDATARSALAIVAWSVSSQLGLRFASVDFPGRSSMRHTLGQSVSSMRTIETNRLREFLNELEGLDPETNGDPDQALGRESRRVAEMLRHWISLKGDYRGHTHCMPPDFKLPIPEEDRWPQTEESCSAALDMVDSALASLSASSDAELDAAFSVLCRLFARSNRIKDCPLFIRQSFFRSDELWQVWIRWLRRNELSLPPNETPPGCCKCLEFARRLFDPEPLEANWIQSVRLRNRAVLERALMLVAALEERRSLWTQSTYFRVRFSLYLNRFSDASHALERFVLEHPAGDAFLEPFLLDFWFCGRKTVTLNYLDRLRAIRENLHDPVLLSCMLASAVAGHEESYCEFECVLASRQTKFGVRFASPAHQRVWLMVAEVPLVRCGPIEEALSGIASAVKPFKRIGSALAKEIRQLV